MEVTEEIVNELRQRFREILEQNAKSTSRDEVSGPSLLRNYPLITCFPFSLLIISLMRLMKMAVDSLIVMNFVDY